MSNPRTTNRYRRTPRSARPRKPQGPDIRRVAIGEVEVAAWLICVNFVEPAKRAEARQSLIEWALSSQMSATALVELAWAIAKNNRRFGELRGEMNKRASEASELEQKIKDAGDEATDELKAEFEAAKAKHQKVGGKPGAVLKMSDEQFEVVKAWGLILCGEPSGEKAISNTLGACIGKGRMHIRTTVELLKRFLKPEDLEAFTAEFEAAGVVAKDANVADLPAADESETEPAADSAVA